MKRHICCKCGRKRNSEYLKMNNCLSDFERLFDINWKSYPQVNSYLCKENCLPYSEDVHFSEGNKIVKF
jgi:hypothetical protein